MQFGPCPVNASYGKRLTPVNIRFHCSFPVLLSKQSSMKKSAGLLLFPLVMIMSCHGQSTPRQKNDSVLALVKRYLNEKSVDSLYALTGAHFRQQIKPDVFKNITTNNLFPLGEIKETSFLKDQDKTTFYKAVFSSATFTLIIGLDSLDK